MIIRNRTPFAPFYFESEDRDREMFATFLLKGTFDIVDGKPLRPSPDQEGLTMGDEHHEKRIEASIRFESDLCPTKVNTDVLLLADAVAPRRHPSTSWEVSIRISGREGETHKRLRVTGPRWWQRSILGRWSLTEPEPCESVPLQYEYAYGGCSTDREGKAHPYTYNPVGRGYSIRAHRTSKHPIPAAQIECPDDPILDLDATYFPQGVGPISRAWRPRIDFAGTYDDDWIRNIWPHLPDNFDFQFYNAAHRDLQLPYLLHGDESVELQGMHESGAVGFRLPGYRVGVFLTDAGGEVAGADLDLDTLSIDLHRMKAHLTWRIATPLEQPIREIEAAMELRSEPQRV